MTDLKKSEQSPKLRIAEAYEATLLKHASLVGNGPIIFAVSGGPDSLAMLLGAKFGKTSDSPQIIVAHFCHGINKEMDQRSVELVRSVTNSLGLKLAVGSADVRALAIKTKQSLETAARQSRYEFFDLVAQENSGTCIMVAHTMDDQAETVLFRLTRGTGLRGATGIRELTSLKVTKRSLKILRPLLGIYRSETIQVCIEDGITPIHDSMNSDYQFARSRIRHSVLPELKKINSAAVDALSRFANLSQEAYEIIKEKSLTLQRGKERRFPEQVIWNRNHIFDLGPSVVGYIFQDAWEYINQSKSSLSWQHIAKMSDLVSSYRSGMIHLPKGFRFIVEQNSVSLISKNAAESTRPLSDLPVPLAIPGSSNIGSWVFETRMFRNTSNQPLVQDNPFIAFFDADSIRYPVALRRRKTRDTIVPLGMEVGVSVKDIFLKNKVRRRLRDVLPVLDSQNGIVWVVGVRIANWARVKDSTERILQISARRFDWQSLDGFFS